MSAKNMEQYLLKEQKDNREFYINIFKNYKLCRICENIYLKEKFRGKICNKCFNHRSKMNMRNRYKPIINKTNRGRKRKD